MYGYGWAPNCPECDVPKMGSHTDGQGNYYCEVHYLIKVKGYVECMGCLATGVAHSNKLPTPGKPACYLCKGKGVLAP